MGLPVRPTLHFMDFLFDSGTWKFCVLDQIFSGIVWCRYDIFGLEGYRSHGWKPVCAYPGDYMRIAVRSVADQYVVSTQFHGKGKFVKEW